jgi:hypothetical protein
MGKFFAVLATGASIFGVGLGMLIARWHPQIGVALMVLGIGYLIYELFASKPLSNAVPGMLRFVFGIVLGCIVVGLMWPSIREVLAHPAVATAGNSELSVSKDQPSARKTIEPLPQPPAPNRPSGPSSDVKQLQQPKRMLPGKEDSGKQRAPQISKEATPKYQAIKLSDEIRDWLWAERPKFVEFDDYQKEIIKQYPLLFETRVNDVTKKLRQCGANTDKVDEQINNINGSYRSITYYEQLCMWLRDAAYDVPGGQSECGTAPKANTGFTEKDNGAYTLKVGHGAITMPEDELEHGPYSPIQVYGMNLFRVYLLNGHFYVDTTVYGGFDQPQVKVVRNEVEVTNHYLDRNFTDKAVEVVDQNRVPILQMIFESDRQVVINGVFATQDGKSAIIITPTGNSKTDIDPRGEKKITVPLKPLFKYPSWKYPGEYAEP